MRSNVNEKSFASSMLYDVERMVEEDQSWEQIVLSVHRRLTKYLKYEASYERNKIQQAAFRRGRRVVRQE